MQLTLRQKITQFAHMLQNELFPAVEESAGTLTEEHKRIGSVLTLIPLRRFVPVANGWNGRPQKDRYAIACAFIAKSILGLGTTRQLLDRLSVDSQLLRLCGWKQLWELPHESTFSRAFAEFAGMELPQFVHEALIRDTHADRLVGHIARDSTAIHARERFPETPSQKRAKAEKPKEEATAKPARRKHRRRQMKHGRIVKIAGPPTTRIERQRGMSLEQMLQEIPQECSIGVKSKANKNHYWRGYKLHLDVADGQIPIAALLSSAHVNDSQLAIPLATISTARVTYLYELMDAAYDAGAIRDHSLQSGHVAIIDARAPGGMKSQLPSRRKQKRQFTPAEEVRYRERTMVERVYARLKDEFGAKSVRVRGPKKVMAHLMFGVLTLTADQLLRLSG